MYRVSYGSEKSYNGLRTAMTLQKREEIQVKVFLFADATTCAIQKQDTPEYYYNIERMIRSVARKGNVEACGVCLDARGLKNVQLIDGVKRSSMNELADWILTSDKVMSF
ncbi:MAG: DsrE/DsrF/TusD sulfur relay family protein [Candidatus Hodarchaeales archaeon]|jgi:uncharacterized protein involved in oxidation of intracellular sulfur